MNNNKTYIVGGRMITDSDNKTRLCTKNQKKGNGILGRKTFWN